MNEFEKIMLLDENQDTYMQSEWGKVANYDRHFVYGVAIGLFSVSSETSLIRIKFGETLVKAGETPLSCAQKRAADWGKVVEGMKIFLVADVSHAAKEKNNHLDDMYRYTKPLSETYALEDKSSSREIHLATSVRDFINRFKVVDGFYGNSARIDFCMSSQQYLAVKKLKKMRNSGNKTVFLGLCARFGKTTTVLSDFVSSDEQMMIFSSYVLSSNSSIINDAGCFEQFRHLKIVEVSNEQDLEEVKTLLQSDKKVIAIRGLCDGEKDDEGNSNRDRLFNSLCQINTKKVLVVDEADFGAHQQNQINLIKKNLVNIDFAILMSGTNQERATSNIEIDEFYNVTYGELLIQKQKSIAEGIRKYETEFGICVDTKNDTYYPDLAAFTCSMKEYVEKYLKNNPETDLKDLPNWLKIVKQIKRNKLFLSNFVQTIYACDDGLQMDDMNVDFLTEKAEEKIGRNILSRSEEGKILHSKDIDMFFFPYGTEKKHLAVLRELFQEILGDRYLVVYINGLTTTNAEAESYVKRNHYIAKCTGRKLIVLSASMAQRSFTVVDIRRLFICYDRGSEANRDQSVSRLLSADFGDSSKIGMVFDFGFDPNPMANVIGIIDDTLTKESEDTFEEKARLIRPSIHVMNRKDREYLIIEDNEFLKESLNNSRISVITAKKFAYSLSETDRNILSGGTVGGKSEQDSFAGKTFEDYQAKTGGKSENDKNQKEDDKNFKKAAEMIETIFDCSDYITWSSGAPDLLTALQTTDKKWRADFKKSFTIAPEDVYNVFKRGIDSGKISRSMIDQITLREMNDLSEKLTKRIPETLRILKNI